MSTIDLNLPDEFRTYLDAQVASRGYKNASEFVQALLEAERHRNLHEDIEAMLLEAADGPFTEWTETDLEDVRRTGTRLIERRKAR